MKKSKKIISLLLAVLMLTSILPIGAFSAAANSFDDATVINVGDSFEQTITNDYYYGSTYYETTNYYSFTAPKKGNYSFAYNTTGCADGYRFTVYNSQREEIYSDSASMQDDCSSIYSFDAESDEKFYFYCHTYFYDYYYPTAGVDLNVNYYVEGVEKGVLDSGAEYSMNFDTGDLTIEGYNTYCNIGYYYDDHYGNTYGDMPWKDLVKNVYLKGYDFIACFYNLPNLESVHYDVQDGDIRFWKENHINDLYINNDVSSRSFKRDYNGEVVNLHIGNNVSPEIALRCIQRFTPENIMLSDDCTNYKIENKTLLTADGCTIIYAFSDEAIYEIPADVDNIMSNRSGSALDGLTNTEEFRVAKGNISFKAIDGVLFDYYAFELIRYPFASSRKHYDIPETVRELGINSMYGASNLTELYLPSSITSIDSLPWSSYYDEESGEWQYTRPKFIVNVGSYAHSYIDDAEVRFDGVKALEINEKEVISAADCDDSIYNVRAITPSETGKYFFDVSGLGDISGNTYCYCYVSIYDDKGENLYYFYGNDSEIKKNCEFTLEAGKTYYASLQIDADGQDCSISVVPFDEFSNGEIYRKGLFYSLDPKTKTASVIGPSSGHSRFDIQPKVNGYTVTSIGDYAFKEIESSLKEINIPETVEKIGNSAFVNNRGLRKVNIDKNNPYIKYVDGVMFNADMTELIWYPDYLKASSYEIPSTVKYINGGAFYNNTYLKSVVIPDSVEIIGEEAFSGTTLKSVEIPSSVKHIGNGAFSSCWIRNLVLNEGLETIGEEAFSWNNFKKVDVPSTVVNIAKGAFSNNQYLTKAIIRNPDVTIGEDAFNSNETIYSAVNSTAQAFAEANYMKFIDIELGYEDGNSNCKHEETKHISIPATCTEAGEEITVCKKCGAFVDYDYVAPIAHDYKLVSKTDATCNHSGETKYACTQCAKEYSEFTAVTDHDFEENVIPATHTSQGYTIKTCKICGFTENTDYTPALTAHIFTNYISDNNATCFKDGTKTAKCEGCEATDTIVDEGTKLTHNYVLSKEVKATCTKSGSKAYICSLCGDSYTEIVPACEHTYIKSVVAPTCTSFGYTTYLCSVCGEMYNGDYVLKANHTMSDKIVAPTCEERGYTLHTCTACGYEMKDSYVPATGHSPQEIKSVEPTCTEAGSTAGSICSECGEILVKTAVIAKKNHEFALKSNQEATCTSRGVKVYECKFCDASYEEYTKAASHNYVKSVISQASCTSKGIERYTCSECGDSYNVETPMLSHTPETDEAIAPTCKSIGLTQGTHCKECGKILEPQQVVPATDNHNYIGKTTKLATCAEEGVKTFTCTVCGDKYSEAIAKLDHTIVTDKAVPATFTAAGKTEGKHCSVCGAIIVAQKAIAKLGSPALSSVTAGSKKFTAKWNSVANIDGYEIQYSTNKNFKSGNKTVTVKGSSASSKTVKSLKAKTKYYVRIRGYKTISGTKQYSSWSASKAVTTK